MSTNSAIEWTDATWNPVTGCSKVSAGCTNCYAEQVSHRFGFTSKPWNAAYAAENVQLHLERLEQPLHWRKPRKVFVNSMSDLFHEQVPFEFIRAVWARMAECPQHTFQVLTKRPSRALEYFKWSDEQDWRVEATLPNVWLGVSVENQEVANERIPLLLQTPAAVRFLSCEPLLGSVNISEYYREEGGETYSVWADYIDWVIVGGESGPNARPMSPWWARDLRDQCQKHEVPFFFKQWGEFAPVHELRCNEAGLKGKLWVNFDPDTSVCRIGKKAAGRMLDGRTWDEYPEVNEHDYENQRRLSTQQ